jgi:hypothetical protein
VLDPATFQSELRRYSSLIEPLLKSSIPPVSSQINLGIIYPLLLTGPWTEEKAKIIEPLIQELAGSRQPAVGSGEPLHSLSSAASRPLPTARSSALLIYSWLMAYRLAYETMPRQTFSQWEEALRPRCEALENRLNEIDWPPTGFSAAEGSTAAEAMWIALALHVAGSIFVRNAWTDLSADVAGKLVRHQQPSGAFLKATAADSPETLTYHELVILHAAASYAVQAADRPLSAAIARAAEFHQNHTQPDHATTEPWALFAFIWHAPTRPLADQILHAVSTHQPSSPTGISPVLLADALYCLRLFL